MSSNTEWGRISIDGRGGHSHARIKIHKHNCVRPKNEGLVVDNHCVYHEGPEGTQIWNILLSGPCLSWKNWYTEMAAVLLNVVPKELMSCWIKVTTVILAMVHWSWTELGTQGSMELDGLLNTIANAARTSAGTYNWSLQSWDSWTKLVVINS